MNHTLHNNRGPIQQNGAHDSDAKQKHRNFHSHDYQQLDSTLRGIGLNNDCQRGTICSEAFQWNKHICMPHRRTTTAYHLQTNMETHTRNSTVQPWNDILTSITNSGRNIDKRTGQQEIKTIKLPNAHRNTKNLTTIFDKIDKRP